MAKQIIYPLISALLLSLGWLNVSGLPLLIALIPLLILSDQLGDSRRDWWRLFGSVSIAMGVWSGVTTWWIWNAAAIGAIMSVVITIVLCGGVFMLYHYVSKRAQRSLAYTILISGWIALEMLYTYGEISFPWLTLGNGFANDITLIQWYEYTGVFGGSLWALLSNVAIYEAIRTRSARQAAVAALLIAIPITISTIIYTRYEESGDDVVFQIVQPNLDPYNAKFTLDQADQDRIMVSLAKKSPSDVDFIVMPETAIDQVNESALNNNRSVIGLRSTLMEFYPNAAIITGATTVKYYDSPENMSKTARHGNTGDYWYDIYNSTLSIDTSSNIGLYHKNKLVVGVEKIPYYTHLNNLKFLRIDLGGIGGQLGTDSRDIVFNIPDKPTVGSAICYEGLYGDFFTQFARNGAEVITISSNDGWWGDTPGHRQLVGFARLRAIENRRSIARSTNTGTSVAINQRGELLVKSSWWTMESLTAHLKTNNKITVYTRMGDYVGRISVYIFLLSMLYYVAYRTRKRSHLI